MSQRRHPRRTDLFLVRIWTDQVAEPATANAISCRGRVQRAVDGETHEFEDWQGLMAALALMLPGVVPDHYTSTPQDEG